MFECNLTKNQLKALAWGELSPDEGIRLRHHIKKCADCQKELKKWQDFYGLLQTARAPVPDKAFWETYQKTLARRLENPLQYSKRRNFKAWSLLTFRFRLVYAIAMVLLVAGIVLTLRFSAPEKAVRVAADSSQEMWADYCVNEFNEVTRDNLLIEPLPVRAVEK